MLCLLVIFFVNTVFTLVCLSSFCQHSFILVCLSWCCQLHLFCYALPVITLSTPLLSTWVRYGSMQWICLLVWLAARQLAISLVWKRFWCWQFRANFSTRFFHNWPNSFTPSMLIGMNLCFFLISLLVNHLSICLFYFLICSICLLFFHFSTSWQHIRTKFGITILRSLAVARGCML